MLNNKIKSLVSICVISSMFLTGCSSTQSLEDRVNEYDDKYYAAAELICRATDANDTTYLADVSFEERREMLKEYNTDLDELQTELDKELEGAKADSTEYKMFKSLDNAASQMDSAYNLVEQMLLEGDSTTINDAATFGLGLSLATFIDNADREYDLFNQYVKELNITINNSKQPLPNMMDEIRNDLNDLGLSSQPTTETENNEQSNGEGTITKSTGKARLCHNCGLEIEAGNNTSFCDHCLYYGNCNDCGKERLKENMTLKNGKYTCGCTDKTFNCAYCNKVTTLDKCVAAAYCSDECFDKSMMISCGECGKLVSPSEVAEYNYQDYCYDCYNSILNAEFGEPASVPEE